MQGTAVRVKELAFVGYPVADMARAKRFYEGVFGLKPAMEFCEGETQWVEYELNGATLSLGKVPQWQPSPSGPMMALEVEDFDHAVERIREENMPIHVEPFETPVCHMAVVGDTEGNTLFLHKRKA